MARNVTDAEIAAARDRGAQMRAAGFAATSVRFDPDRRRILLELTNGALFGVPVSTLPNIAGATDADLATVELLGETVVHIESLDADYSVAGLVTNAVGRVTAARTLGRAGGVVTSEAKADAARRNGAKGGRPPALGRGTVKRSARAGKVLVVREASTGAFTGGKKTAKSKKAAKGGARRK